MSLKTIFTASSAVVAILRAGITPILVILLITFHHGSDSGLMPVCYRRASRLLLVIIREPKRIKQTIIIIKQIIINN